MSFKQRVLNISDKLKSWMVATFEPKGTLHDGRYYTKAQVDSIINNFKQQNAGSIKAAGVICRGSIVTKIGSWSVSLSGNVGQITFSEKINGIVLSCSAESASDPRYGNRVFVRPQNLSFPRNTIAIMCFSETDDSWGNLNSFPYWSFIAF